VNGSDRSARVLVVGASQAGVQLACSLREHGWTGTVTVIGAEAHPPYERPPLSKKALVQGIDDEALHFRSPSFYADKGITLALGRHVDRIDQNADGSGVAVTSDGETFNFDRLALTTGARPRQLPLPGASLPGVLSLRSVDDATTLRQRLRAASRVVVVGGGFIGLEVAASALQLGKAVTVVLLDDRLMARAVGAPVSAFFLDAHRRRGVQVHLSTKPVAFLDDGAGALRGVELDDGRVLDADLVLVGVGATPNTELAQQLGLDVTDGIVVDERMLTSDGRTVAAGDCVRCPTPVSGSEPAQIRFESVSTAVEQAKVAAATLAGAQAAYTAVPWFWSDQGTLKLQAAGLTGGHDTTVLRGDPDDEAFTVLYYRQERLIAVEAVNRPADFLAARAALNAGRSISREAAPDVSVPLKKLQVELIGPADAVPLPDNPPAAGSSGTGLVSVAE
jgi:3-phenylpropionate/trans-cinnamate dioxygenase ferredoxin reductase subunit